MSITWQDVAGKWASHNDLTAERLRNIETRLIPAVHKLMMRAIAAGVRFPENPKTGTCVSGDTLGGFRPQECAIGAPRSNHKQGLAVDLYDPAGEIDAWCMVNFPELEECGIWIEHPSATPGWSHWQCLSPKSGRRAFMP